MIRERLAQWLLGTSPDDIESVVRIGGRLAAIEARLDRAEGLIQLLRAEVSSGPSGIDRRVLPKDREGGK